MDASSNPSRPRSSKTFWTPGTASDRFAHDYSVIDRKINHLPTRKGNRAKLPWELGLYEQDITGDPFKRDEI
jgi:hypothetical protein